jgi:hypothetical protein
MPNQESSSHSSAAQLQMEQGNESVKVRFTETERSSSTGKLASAELLFTSGVLSGCRLVGFGVWKHRTTGRNVTVPSRQYFVNGQRRTFALLRPIDDSAPKNSLRDWILAEFAAHESKNAVPTADDDFPDLPRP